MAAGEISAFQDPVLKHARPAGPLLRQEMTVGDALRVIREHGAGERIIYFYVTDSEDRLTGVLPTRRLLSEALEAKLEEVMIRRVLAIPRSATLLEACELFVLHKYLAFPIVDEKRQIQGVIDISVLTQEMLEAPEPERGTRGDEIFEALGLRLSQLRGASPWAAFRGRFPWLLATVMSGTIAAFIAGIFEETMTSHIVIAFFLAMVLALGESVSMQSMTLTLQSLRTATPSRRWFWDNIRREGLTALLLGLGCGTLVFLITWIWRGSAVAAGVIGGSIFGALGIAALVGFSTPSILHALKLDPKIAAGPAALAITDVLTLLLYLSLATWVLT